jgi:hypothetical protein
MVGRGELLGAARIGKVFTFDPTKLRAWLAAREAECLANRTSIGAALSDSGPLHSSVQNAVRAYERAMAASPGGYAKRESI